jgi:Uncharacterized protein conserved in bacteria (DUF2188)
VAVRSGLVAEASGKAGSGGARLGAYREGQWLNEVEGARPMRGNFRLKTDAVEAGRRRAQRDKVEHLIHTRDGTIGSRNSYGTDPRRSKG